MSEEKQIKKMARDLCHLDLPCDLCVANGDCKAMTYARRAYEKDYRKQSEVVDGFIKAMIDRFGINPFDRMNFDVRDLVELGKKYTEEQS